MRKIFLIVIVFFFFLNESSFASLPESSVGKGENEFTSAALLEPSVEKREKEDLIIPPKVVPRKKSPFYVGGNWGMAYQVTDLDVTQDNNYLQLGLHPFVLEAFAGYRLWWFRFEGSFLYRPMKKYKMSYEASDENRSFLVLDYEVAVSTYALNFKVFFDMLSFKTYFNPYFGVGVSLAGTQLKSWSETEKREKNNASRVIPGKAVSSLALLGIIGNSFPLTDKVDLQLQYQFTFLQEMATQDKASFQDLSNDSLNKLKAPPLEGLIVTSDFLLGARYSL